MQARTREIVVIKSANVASIGITKLSGFQPRLKVKIAVTREIRRIIGKHMILDDKVTKIFLRVSMTPIYSVTEPISP